MQEDHQGTEEPHTVNIGAVSECDPNRFEDGSPMEFTIATAPGEVIELRDVKGNVVHPAADGAHRGHLVPKLSTREFTARRRFARDMRHRLQMPAPRGKTTQRRQASVRRVASVGPPGSDDPSPPASPSATAPEAGARGDALRRLHPHHLAVAAVAVLVAVLLRSWTTRRLQWLSTPRHPKGGAR